MGRVSQPPPEIGPRRNFLLFFFLPCFLAVSSLLLMPLELPGNSSLGKNCPQLHFAVRTSIPSLTHFTIMLVAMRPSVRIRSFHSFILSTVSSVPSGRQNFKMVPKIAVPCSVYTLYKPLPLNVSGTCKPDGILLPRLCYLTRHEDLAKVITFPK